MYGRTQTMRFEEVRLTATKSGACTKCGKRRRRQRKFWQTINPFNTDDRGVPKDRSQITDELQAKILAWREENFICASCDEDW